MGKFMIFWMMDVLLDVLWMFYGLFMIFYGCFGLDLWDDMGECGRIWKNMGEYGRIWDTRYLQVYNQQTIILGVGNMVVLSDHMGQ